MHRALAMAACLAACTPDPIELRSPTTPTLGSTSDTGGATDVPVGVSVRDWSALAGTQGPEFGGDLKHGRTCVVADLDGDGAEDLLIGNPADPSYWYRNTSTPGNPSFAPGAELSPDALWWGTSAADVDNDGDLDLAVAVGGFEGSGPNMLLRNDLDLGAPTFRNIAPNVGMIGVPGADPGTYTIGASVSAVWLDVDGDADLDLWIDETTDPPALSGRPIVDGTDLGRNTLWINEGNGDFVDGTVAAGLGGHNEPSHWSSWFDFDNDGDLDLLEPVYRYAGGLNHFWVNDGTTHFEDRADSMMLDGDDLRYPIETFSSAVADVNQDGWLDALMFARGQPEEGTFVEGHRLLLNVEGRGFVEASGPSGLNDDFDPGFRDHVINGVMGSSAEDINLDGIPDIYIGNGGPTDGWPDQLFLSKGLEPHDFPGVGTLMVPVYANATELVDFPADEIAGGPEYPPYPYRTHGICITDVDGDGTREAIVINGGLLGFGGDASKEPDRLFSFTVDPKPHRLVVHLDGDGVSVNPNAIHSRIAVTVEEAGAERTVYDMVLAHNGFGAQHGYVRTLGLGQAERIVRVEITWPNGEVTTVTDVDLDSRIDLTWGVMP